MLFFKILKIAVLIVTISNGLFFVSNIYVIGNSEAALKMHDDLPPDAGYLWAYAKVLNVFITGILYLVSAYGVIRKKYSFCISGIIASIIFIGMYLIQIILWVQRYSPVLKWFCVFGSFSLLIGIFSFIYWKKNETQQIN
jgi:hypothetical protein